MPVSIADRRPCFSPGPNQPRTPEAALERAHAEYGERMKPYIEKVQALAVALQEEFKTRDWKGFEVAVDSFGSYPIVGVVQSGEGRSCVLDTNHIDFDEDLKDAYLSIPLAMRKLDGTDSWGVVPQVIQVGATPFF